MRQRQALGIRQRVGDRNRHVRNRHLRDHRAVDHLDHRMDDALRMNHDGDLLGRQIEQPVRLDHFEPLVHQGRGIDRDLAAHPPGRMIERLGDGYRCETIGRKAEKRTARRGQNDALERGAAASFEALENRVVLAIDRQQAYAALAHRGRHHLARDDQHFLVGERDILAGLDRRERGTRARARPPAPTSRVWPRMRRDGDRAFACHARISTFAAAEPALRSRASSAVATETSSGRSA